MFKPYLLSLLAGMSLLLSASVVQAQRRGPSTQAQRPGAVSSASSPTSQIIANPTDPDLPNLDEETPWSHLIDSLTAHLDKSQVKSGILYDRALPLAMLHAFNLSQVDTTANGHWRQAYLELWIAAYNRKPFRYTPDELRERANQIVRHDSVPLGILDYRFDYFDSLAVRDKLVQVQDGLLYDVITRPPTEPAEPTDHAPTPTIPLDTPPSTGASSSRSPYLQRDLTLVAPLLDTLRETSARFTLPAALLLTNRDRRVSNVDIDFNDGGPTHNLVPGQSITISYPTNGRKILTFNVRFDDESHAHLRASFYVKVPVVSHRSEPIRLANLAEVEAKIPFRGYSSFLPMPLYGKGEVLAVLHHPATQSEFDNGQPIKLRRPVIVMDGFDPQDKSRIFRNLTPQELSVYNLLDSLGILKLLDDKALKRDLIILNFPKSPRNGPGGFTTPFDLDGGADYVERNAFVLVELLNQLKPLLDTDPATGQPYQFTVIGPSMGGLVSRYALAYMEKQKYDNATPPAGQTAAYWEHNTATWLSFDTPHQGAAVPMGDQAFLNFFKGMADGARESLNTSLYSPAARQMIVHHLLANSSTPAGAPGFRDRFMLALRDNGEPGSLGYPVHLRRIALADGRLDGQPDPGGSFCGDMFKLDASFRKGNAFLLGIGNLLFTPHNQFPINIANCTARYAPAANTSCVVFEGKLNYETFSIQVPGGGTYSTSYSQVTVDSGPQGSYDLAPGGLRNTQATLKQLAEGAGRTGAGKEEPYNVTVTNVHGNHCFIPTVSALGFQYQTMSNYQDTGSLPDAYANLSNRNLVCNNETPFDDYYAPTGINLNHVAANEGAKDFLIRELTPRTAKPVFVTAANLICPGNSASFAVAQPCQLPGRAVPITYTWSFPQGGLQFAPGSPVSGPSVTIQTTPAAQLNISYPVVVTASQSGVAPNSTTTYVSVSYGTIQVSMLSPATEVIVGNPVDFIATFNQAQGPLTWHVTVDGHSGTQAANQLASPYGPNAVRYRPLRSGPMTVTAEGFSLCDPTTEVTGTSPNLLVIPGQNRSTGLSAYPNPASTQLTVLLTATQAPAQAMLYNGQGLLVRQQTAAAGAATILFDTTTLPAGLYNLIVRQGEQVERQHLEVKH